MPNWTGPILVSIAFVAFIVFAFRQGTKVSPDRTDNGGSDLPGISGGGDGA
jgi:cbb3-type cytochrome oxidase subunit 3